MRLIGMNHSLNFRYAQEKAMARTFGQLMLDDEMLRCRSFPDTWTPMTADLPRFDHGIDSHLNGESSSDLKRK
jgi:hypothetical protein